jgi:monofunctional glycosyltransferase
MKGRSGMRGGRRSGGRVRLLGRSVVAAAAAMLACAAYLYLTLPDVRPLRTSNPDSTAFIDLRAREARARGETPRRVQHWVPYREISPHLTRAVIVAEDAAFWRHDGIDYVQIRESLAINLERRELARGASTITQQLAKNLYLTPSKNPVRKIREVWLARRLEAELPKERILELYLNVIEWGDGVYGAEAAARTYFSQSSAALSPQESALLAAAIVNPRVFNPARPSPRLRQRQQTVLRRMGMSASSRRGPAVR